MIGMNVKPSCNIYKQLTPAHYLQRFWIAGCISALALLITGCGGSRPSSFSSPSFAKQNPEPKVTMISPSSASAGSRALTLTVTGSGFVTDSEVKWRGSSRTTAYLSSTQLTAQITPNDLSSAGTAPVAVFNPTPGGGTSGTLTFTINVVSPLSFLTTLLPDAAHDKAYSYTLQASGGIQPYTWSITNGSLPSGLNLSSGGALSGTAPGVADDTSYDFTVQLSDYAYQANTLTKPLSIRVRSGSLGRNDTCDAATPISDGIIRASISPFADIDVFSFHGTEGQRVTIEIYAQRLTLYGDSTSVDVFLDPFLELLDSACTRIFYSDDIDTGVNQDSLIPNFKLPVTGTYYIRISDLRGDGRPDFIYELHLSGAD
jgi:hypothetical protein